MSSETVSLLPCPFCGAEMVLTEREEWVHPWNDTCPADDIHISYRDEPRLSAWNTRSKPMASGVEVKPLEWETFGDLKRAKTGFDTAYFVNPRTSMWIGQADDWALAEDPSAAAEADYRNRILSALLPKATAPVVSEPVATIDRAMDCESWPKWLGDLVEFAMQASDAADMSTEQVIAYAILHHSAAPQPQPKAVTEEMVERAWFDAQKWPTPISRSMVRRALEAALKED